MTTTYSYLVSLASALIVLVHIEGRCVRVAEVTEINIEGYRTRAVHTNACRETTSASILPRISVGVTTNNKTYIKRYEDSCCCTVTSSRQMVVLEAVSVGSSLPVYYRRVDSCDCERCRVPMYKTAFMDVEYTDDIFFRR